jgi:multiple sugar transport system substrate-binding protein
MKSSARKILRALLIAITAVFFCACGGQEGGGGKTLTIWAHAGQAAERQVLESQVDRYRRLHPDMPIKLTLIPERSYNAQVQAAAIAGGLPDVLELDGPYLYNYAWQGHLRPLKGLIPAQTLSDLLPSIRTQGSYRSHLYGVGCFDSGLAIYARKSTLKKTGIAVSDNPARAWDVATFERVLERLSRSDPDGAVLDLKLNYPDEWFPYAFSPMLESAGGDLIDRKTYRSAQGRLNGREAVAAMKHIQGWLQTGKVDANVDDAAFVSGRVALSLAGHWEYRRYHQAWGKDLQLLPLPDFGRGTRTAQGSWLWTVTRKSRQAEAAAGFIRFLLQPGEILAMTEANGAVPAREAAIARSPLYRSGGPLNLFVVQLRKGYSVPRPRTPAYPVISSAFRHAFADIRNGGKVQAALDGAVALIDQDIRDNHGYPVVNEATP